MLWCPVFCGGLLPKDCHLFITQKHSYPGLSTLISHHRSWRRPIKVAEDFLSALTFHFSATFNCCKVSLLGTAADGLASAVPAAEYLLQKFVLFSLTIPQWNESLNFAKPVPLIGSYEIEASREWRNTQRKILKCAVCLCLAGRRHGDLDSLLLVCADALNNCAFHWPFAHAAAVAKSLQSCPTLCDPIDGSPPGSPAPGILQARTLEWVAISFSNAWKWKVKSESEVAVMLDSATPWTAAHQAPPSMGFSRQEYCSGVPLPSLPFAHTASQFLSAPAFSLVC